MYDNRERKDIEKQLERLYFAYAVNTDEMNFSGVIGILDHYNIPAASVGMVLSVVSKVVCGQGPGGNKRVPAIQDFTDAISALRYNDYDIEKAIKAIFGR